MPCVSVLSLWSLVLTGNFEACNDLKFSKMDDDDDDDNNNNNRYSSPQNRPRKSKGEVEV